RDGHSEETTIFLPADTSGSKNSVQAVGSSTSYGKRYTASALLNITTRGEDDDGRAAGAGETISREQLEELTALLDSVNADKRKFCEYFRIPGLADLPKAKFAAAIKAAEAKRAKP